MPNLPEGDDQQTYMSRHSNHQSLTSNWNWVHIISDQTGIKFTTQLIPGYLASEGHSDPVPLFNSRWLSHGELGHETAWERFSAHLEHASKWNKQNIISHGGDIQLLSWVITNIPDLNLH